ncbi:MAG: alpha/beta fold hydrolase [Rickettsiales bacterium]
MNMPYINVNNITFFYEQLGQGEPLILIGGLSSNHTIWEKITEDLAQRFNLILPDNRGVGKSTQPNRHYTIDQMAEDIAQLMNAIGIDSAYMVGHSMGGCILQKLCIDHPEKVKAAVIVGAAAKMPQTLIMQTNGTIKLTDAAVNIELIIENILPWLFASSFLENKDNVQAEVARMLHEPDPQSYAGFVGQVKALETFDVRQQLSNIKCPTLVIGGSEDLLVMLKHQQFIHGKIPQAQFAIMEDCGHMFQREKPKEFMELIVNFIDSLS